MNEPRYVVTIRQLACGKWRWDVEAGDDNRPLPVDLWEDPPFGTKRSFGSARRKAANFVAGLVERDVLAELADTFESNSPIAQASAG